VPQPTEAAVSYRDTSPGRFQALADIYLPEQPTGSSILLVHGGGFLLGSRQMKPIRFLASRLLTAGIAVCAVDYRLLFRGGGLDEASTDVSDALAWWQQQARTRGLKPKRVSILGISAGGTLALLAAGKAALPVHRTVGIFGLYDLDYLNGPICRRLPKWLLGTTDRAIWRQRSPMRQKQCPSPLLLVHGTEDGLVPVEQAYQLEQHRQQSGLETSLLIFEGEPHAFLNRVAPVAEQTADAIIRFVETP
jgi:acetyl esterase/lipase